MEIIRKFTAIQIVEKKVNDNIEVELKYGEITGPYYSQEHPETEFDSSVKAIEYAYEKNKYANWLILPVISFKN